MLLTNEEITRYSRNILLNEVKRLGQEKLKSSKVTVIGAGGLGSPVLYYLSSAGVGNIQIIDSDLVDLTNLQRQILFNENSIGKEKSEEAKKKLKLLNSNIEITSSPFRIEKNNAIDLLKNSDIIIEGSDNFQTKFLVNSIAQKLKIPLLIGGILRFDGQVIGIRPNIDPCYECIFQNTPENEDFIPSCSIAGVLGSVAGIIGSILATECLKYLINQNEDGLFGKILQVDTKSMIFRNIKVNKRKNCNVCGL